MEDVNVCSFDYSGFCKFGDYCQRHHFREICQDRSCRNSSCQKRHPRVCYFFINFRNCKFGTDCRYLHESSKPVIVEFKSNFEEVQELENVVKKLQYEIKNKEYTLKMEAEAILVLKEKFGALEEENEKLKYEINAKEKEPPKVFCKLNVKNVKRDFDKLTEEKKTLTKEMNELKDRNAKMFEILREETKRRHKFEAEVKPLKRRLGEIVTDSESESD